MLLRVVRMRYRGQKLPQDVVRDARAEDGWLHIRTIPWRPHWMPDRPLEMTAIAVLTELHNADSKRLLPPLHDAYVHNMKGYQFTLVGYEILTAGPRQEEYRQAWWCRGATNKDVGPRVVDESVALLRQWQANDEA